MSRSRAFMYGQLSGLVEPVGGVLGALAVSAIEPLLPYALALSAGAMLFVVVYAVMPETRQKNGSNPAIACWALMIGFALMGALDTSL
jgi:ZIP family zinc transporter